MGSVHEGFREGKRSTGDSNRYWVSEAWRAPTKIAAETQETAYDRAKSEFESLVVGVSLSLNISLACALS